VAGGRTGSVFLRNFDEGLVVTIGGELIDIELDGETVQEYALRVNGVTGPDAYNGMVPIIFMNPEDVYQRASLPHVVVSRSSIQPAMNRWQPGGRAYMVPAANTSWVDVDGVRVPTLIELADPAVPFDITYDLHIRARLRAQGDIMLRQIGGVLGHVLAYAVLFVKDSEGDERSYEAFVESVDNLDEVADIADRTMGHTLSIRVEAELDFRDPVLRKTCPNLKFNYAMMDDRG
jgi:hypothetical protein